MSVGHAPPTTTVGRHRVEQGAEEAPVRWRWRRPALPDVAVVGGYLVLAIYVTSKLWLAPNRMVSWWPDETLFEWHLAHAAHALVNLENPLFSTSLNAPDGFNVMANTHVLGVGLPLAPIALLFGAHTTFLVALVVSFAGTAAGWYLMLSRSLGVSRPAASVAGALAGFAPGIIAQATGHLHITAQFLVPAIVWAVLRLEPRNAVRGGIGLGLLITWQAFISEEVLLLTALALAVVFATLALADRAAARHRWRAIAKGLGVAGATASTLLAYPLWFQFFGPGHYRGIPFDPADYPLDLKSYVVYGRYSLAGQPDPIPLAPNPTEEASFLGAALVALCVVIVVGLWRRPLARALAVAIALFGLLSLGNEIIIGGEPTGIAGPYRLVGRLPLLDAVVPARFALVLAPLVGVLVALSIDQIAAGSDQERRFQRIWLGAVAAALLPIAPLPLATYPVPPVPEFITSGEWRAYVPEGRTIVPAVPVGIMAVAGTAWSARTGLAFATPGGLFNGPTSPDDPTARYGSGPDRPSATLLYRVAMGGSVPLITDRDREQMVEDLRYWRAAIVVLGAETHGDALHRTLDALIGAGVFRSGAWVWDVRTLVA